MVKPRENRVPIMMSEDELRRIDDFRFHNRINTRSSAIRQLCSNGINFGEQLRIVKERSLQSLDALNALVKSLPEPNHPLVAAVVEQAIQAARASYGHTGDTFEDFLDAARHSAGRDDDETFSPADALDVFLANDRLYFEDIPMPVHPYFEEKDE